jgi:hypothetical protein
MSLCKFSCHTHLLSKQNSLAAFLFLYLDCPTYAAITPSNLTNGIVVAGTVLTCSSDGYYTPSYAWTDTISGLTVNGATYTLPSTGGNFSLVCTATADVPGCPICNKTANISGLAVGELYLSNRHMFLHCQWLLMMHVLSPNKYNE